MSNPSPAPKPIALTEQQALALFAASYPLPPDRRSDFLIACAKEIAALPELGDGVLYRTIARVQREYFDPASLDSGRMPRNEQVGAVRGRPKLGTLVPEKRLFLNVRSERLLGTPHSEKPCCVNERLGPF
jgi:hypothetical protein